MLRKLFSHTHHATGVAYLALFVALGGTGAYAANTIGSTDIIDGEVKSVDIGSNEIGSSDVKDNSLNTFDVHSFLGADVVDGSLTSADIQDFSLGNGDFLDGSVDGRVITDNSVASADVQLSSLQGVDVAANTLTGADINESSLTMPPTTTATFAGPPSAVTLQADTFTKVVGKTLPAASYAIAATANYSGSAGADVIRDIACELRNGGGFIGGATDRREFPAFQVVKSTLSMNGGAQVPAGGEVSLWCKVQGGGGSIDYAQMMIIRIDGFF